MSKNRSVVQNRPILKSQMSTIIDNNCSYQITRCQMISPQKKDIFIFKKVSKEQLIYGYTEADQQNRIPLKQENFLRLIQNSFQLSEIKEILFNQQHKNILELRCKNQKDTVKVVFDQVDTCKKWSEAIKKFKPVQNSDGTKMKEDNKQISVKKHTLGNKFMDFSNSESGSVSKESTISTENEMTKQKSQHQFEISPADFKLEMEKLFNIENVAKMICKDYKITLKKKNELPIQTGKIKAKNSISESSNLPKYQLGPGRNQQIGNLPRGQNKKLEKQNSQLQCNLDEKDKKISDQYQTKLRQYQAKINQYKSQKQLQQKQLKNQKIKNQNIENKWSQFQNKIEELENEKKQLSEKQNYLQNKSNNQQNKLKKLEKEKESIKNQYNQLKLKNDQNIQQITKAYDDINNLKNQLSIKCKNIESAQKNIKKLNAQIQLGKKQRVDLLKQLKNQQQETNKEKSKKQSCTLELQQCKNLTIKQNEQIQQAKTLKIKQNEQMQKDKIQISKQKTKIYQFKNQIQKQNKQILQLRSQVSRQNTQISQLKSKISKQNTEISQLKSQVSKQNTQISQLKSQVSKQSTQISQLKSQVSKQNTQISQLKSQVSRQSTQIYQLKNQISKQSTQISQLKSQKSKQHLLIQQLKDQKQQLTSLTRSQNSRIQQLRTSRFQQMFQKEALTNQNTDIKQFLATEIQNFVGRHIKFTRLLYAYHPQNKANFHKFFDGIPNICVVIRTKKDYLLAGFSSNAFVPNRSILEGGLLISLIKRKSYQLIKNKRAITYDEFYLTFGNDQIRILTNDKNLYSNFGINNGFYDSKGDKLQDFIGPCNDHQVEMKAYEIYQVVFNGQ